MKINWEEGLPFQIGPYEMGLSEPSPETAEYWRGLERSELMIKRCGACSEPLHPRRMFCPECRSHDLRWERSQGVGTVYTFSTVHRAPNPEFASHAPYTNGIVELDEGVFVFGRIDPPSGGEVAIGRRVKVGFRALVEDGEVLPVYKVQS